MNCLGIKGIKVSLAIKCFKATGEAYFIQIINTSLGNVKKRDILD